MDAKEIYGFSLNLKKKLTLEVNNWREKEVAKKSAVVYKICRKFSEMKLTKPLFFYSLKLFTLEIITKYVLKLTSPTLKIEIFDLLFHKV